MRAPVLLLAVVLAGCVDQDPFGLAERGAAGPYRVIDSEFGYYLVGPVPPGTDPESPVGRMTGDPYWGFNVSTLGQRGGYIVGGSGDVWVVIDTEAGGVEGPLGSAAAHRRAAELGVELQPVEEAWEQLHPGPWTMAVVGVFVAGFILFLIRAGRSSPHEGDGVG